MQQAAKLHRTGITSTSRFPEAFEKSEAVNASVYLFMASATRPVSKRKK
jgi:hypothetical protein